MTTATPTKVLVAVDDSPAALAAVRLAVDVARHTGACIRFVHVTADGELLSALRALHHGDGLVERRVRGAGLLLRHVEAEAERAGVVSDTRNLEGDPAHVLLAEARDWQADLLVVGRSDVAGAGRAYVGAVTRQLLEFSEHPVLVVPQPSAGA